MASCTPTLNGSLRRIAGPSPRISASCNKAVMPPWPTCLRVSARLWRKTNHELLRASISSSEGPMVVSPGRPGGAGGHFHWRFRQPHPILLLVPLRLPVLARAVVGLFCGYHDSSTRRRPVGVSDTTFPGSRVFSPAADVAAADPNIFWPVRSLSVGAAG